jgi:polyisoprenoid-binding protein YceI
MRAPTLALALSIAVAAMAHSSSACAGAGAAESYAIDAAKSKATFSVQHIFVERVTGSVPIVGGNVVLPPDSAIPVSLSADLDPSKIESGDRDRDAALESPDFFDVKADPEWTFTSTKITPLNASAFGVNGTLTMHGVSVPEHLDVAVRGDAAHRVYHAVSHVDRRAFHMTVTRLDPVIGNIVDVTLDIALK